MNSKLISGSILAGCGTLVVVASSWASHFFFTQYHIARRASLEGAGEFDPGPYGTDPAAVQPFIGTRVLVWVVVLLGLGLLVWGVLEEHRGAGA